ncbi:MAG TPA: DUF1579 domain-containing protein [Gemmataceae bacterium]|nr:DUF1579 domain-containing protein [Gemmataceae bacterium]
MRKFATLTLLLSLAALLAGGASLAEDKKKDAPDEKAAMEAMMKAAMPGEPHRALASLAGSWEQTIKMWMDPSKPPTESKSTSESKMIMEGRYLEDKITGEFGGMKFLGQSVTGYDNLKKKYTFTWIDNFGTGISTASGTYDPDKKTYTYLGEETDPLSGKTMKTKMVTHVTDKDHYEMDMYHVAGDKDVKAMHIDCVRKGAK